MKKVDSIKLILSVLIVFMVAFINNQAKASETGVPYLIEPIFPDNQDVGVNNYISITPDSNSLEQELEFLITNKKNREQTINVKVFNAYTSPSGIIQYQEIEDDNSVIIDDVYQLRNYVEAPSQVTLEGGQSKRVKVKVDKVKPMLTLTPDPTDITHGNVSVMVKAVDEHSGIKEVLINEERKIKDGKVEIPENGTYEFSAVDNAGNVTTKTITINNIDKSISFETPEIGTFDDVTLQNGVQKVTTDVSPVVIKDWRDGENNWRVDVSASQLRNRSHSLPKGTMRLKEVSRIDKVDGSGKMPTKGFSSTRAFDDGKVSIVQGNGSRGEYNVVFPNDALEILIDPTTAKIGTYRSTIAWDLTQAP